MGLMAWHMFGRRLSLIEAATVKTGRELEAAERSKQVGGACSATICLIEEKDSGANRRVAHGVLFLP